GGTYASGSPASWAATPGRGGVHLLRRLSPAAADRLADQMGLPAATGQVSVVSLHWGSNWGYEIPPEHVEFAHRLIDRGVDIIHGHSSHHPRPIEVYRDRLILYGCGDLINDYEGIRGYEELRDALRVGELVSVDVAPGACASATLPRTTRGSCGTPWPAPARRSAPG